MAYSGEFGRTIVLRARRDTVGLVAGATLATFALASVIHSHPAPQTGAAPAPQQQWTGGLADVTAPARTVASAQPLTSASFVVSSAELALPKVPERALVKLHGCEGYGCAVPTPVRRPAASAQQQTPTMASADTSIVRRTQLPVRRKPTLMSRLNPLRHLPDMATIKRPFAVAGDTVSGWFRRF